MIRYGYMRAVNLDVEVNSAQRLAEDNRSLAETLI